MEFVAWRKISIHALREEGDDRRYKAKFREVISIHALREEGDLRCQFVHGFFHISIHALREEGDQVPGRFTRTAT